MKKETPVYSMKAVGHIDFWQEKNFLNALRWWIKSGDVKDRNRLVREGRILLIRVNELKEE